MARRFVLRPVVAPLVCLAVLGAAIQGAAAERGEGTRAVAASRGRRAAEALPPGRFRTALLAELAALDARRPAVAPTSVAGEIIVTPPEPEPEFELNREAEPNWEVEPALASTPEPAAEPPTDAAPEPLFDSSVALAAATAAALDAAASARPAAAPPNWVDPFAAPSESPAAPAENAAEQKAAAEAAAERRAEAERLERERIEAERRDAARRAAERAEAERMNAERAEAERLAAQQQAEAAAKAAATAKAEAAANAAAVHTPVFGAVCPVTLRDEMRLAPARAEHAATHDGAPWHFATPEARAAFLTNPTRYQPVAGGGDVVLGVLEGFRVPGRPDRCVVFRDRLYLFASDKTRGAFVQQPRRYAAAVEATEAAD